MSFLSDFLRDFSRTYHPIHKVKGPAKGGMANQSTAVPHIIAISFLESLSMVDFSIYLDLKYRLIVNHIF